MREINPQQTIRFKRISHIGRCDVIASVRRFQYPHNVFSSNILEYTTTYWYLQKNSYTISPANDEYTEY